MQNNILIWTVAGLVVVGSGLFFWYNGTKVPVSEVTAETGQAGSTVAEEVEPGYGEDDFDVVISFTNEGFEPSEITVKKGDTVRFVNTSDREVWPASAIHPTHSIYPGKSDSDCLGSSFDACRGLVPGEFWEYTFDYAGSWRYHDHLSASKTGVVVVE
jgi:plastocyanin